MICLLQEEGESNKSSEEDNNKEDNDKEFSLTNLINKVKSTHSPGPNLHPSPRVQQQVRKGVQFQYFIFVTLVRPGAVDPRRRV